MREILNHFDGVASKIQSDEIDMLLETLDMSNLSRRWSRRLGESCDGSGQIESVNIVGFRTTRLAVVVVGRFQPCGEGESTR